MTALGEWLKQMVIIVLLAVFTELLLPTKAMQKYVRMVMGLAIIAAMLQPIVPLFQRDWADQAAAAAAREVTGTNATDATAPGGGEASGWNAQSAAGMSNLSGLRSTLQSETDQTIDDLLASYLQQNLEDTEHLSISSITVTGSAEQGSLQVVVHANLTPEEQSEVRQSVAKQLGISTSRVSVLAPNA
ncbi:stage III sporulation protein AF [Alicyclobacillus cycloheptanicus]|uniref:Stage III sporulation protein AF n=1 Tax=Alicyclobacillus cycloheptanicus TaxID=1457 RepID=A0ABT9XDH9_9BACL|nr:stage III sporulation protein AF [Alicyclobacillus cycloheptanicus]MDQ0188354.1 stage III sporulation protein AF [Alicyclobacillus cycloheptanicus]WDM01063.1 stage III sporulation protein AF [Alicyclobacillus cycloheptanicus]